jgi:hypothetical protein
MHAVFQETKSVPFFFKPPCSYERGLDYRFIFHALSDQHSRQDSRPEHLLKFADNADAASRCCGTT